MIMAIQSYRITERLSNASIPVRTLTEKPILRSKKRHRIPSTSLRSTVTVIDVSGTQTNQKNEAGSVSEGASQSLSLSLVNGGAALVVLN